MNEIISRGPSRAVSIPETQPVLPDVSQRVAAMVAEYGQPRLRGVPAGKTVSDLTPEERERTWLAPMPDFSRLADAERKAARQRADTLETLLSTKVYSALFQEWVSPLLLAARNAPTNREDAAKKATALFSLLDDLPARAFTLDAQRAVASAVSFIPSAADIRAVVGRQADAWQRELAGLREAARGGQTQDAAPASDPEPPLTDDEVSRRIAAYAARPDKFAMAAVRVLRAHLERTDPAMLARHAEALDRVGVGEQEKVERPDRPTPKATNYDATAHMIALEMLVEQGMATGATKMRLESLRRQLGVEAAE